MLWEHTDAVLGLLRAVPNLTVYDGRVPDAPVTPYVVVYSSAGTAGRESLVPVSDALALPFQVTSVGKSTREALWAAERSRAALLDVVPTVSGRRLQPIAQDSSSPVRRDDSVDPPLLFVVDTYSTISRPLTAA